MLKAEISRFAEQKINYFVDLLAQQKTDFEQQLAQKLADQKSYYDQKVLALEKQISDLQVQCVKQNEK